MSGYPDLVAEAEAAPIEGWDFAWLEGRATEERPSWRYSEMVAGRVAGLDAVVDLQTGGGEMVGGLPDLPRLMVATEGWLPNLAVAARRLGPRGVHVVATSGDQPGIPFRDGSFDLVTSRHPVVTWWEEVARVLRPGGAFLSQQVGPRSVGELAEFLMGPPSGPPTRDPEQARAAAQSAGLEVRDLRAERLRTVFYDIGAVVYCLRLVVWIVPGFTVAAYRQRLEELHRVIEREGCFVAHATRFLIEARKPARR